MLAVLLLIGGCLLIPSSEAADLPCLARDVGIEGRSVVCVCNADYCDTITREPPAQGEFVVYTSSDAGQRFEKSYGAIEDISNAPFDDVDVPDGVRSEIQINTNRRFQTIEGFGGSVTDAASINWRKLSDATQTNLIDTYFGPEGLEYNMIRVPIGGADFSDHPYTLNDYPWHDAQLTNFSLTDEDILYKLPMIRRCLEVATDEVKITASTWSPPVWMKTNERITGFAQLKPEYYQAYADYHIKFMEEYSNANVKIWALTTTNEPLNGIIPIVQFNSLGWTPSQHARWIANNFGPTLRNSRFSDTKLIAVDDQRYLLNVWLRGMEAENRRAFDYIDGFAVHYYGNFAPASILDSVHNSYPNKIILATEACEGPMPWHLEKVEMGSWRRARRYATNIMEDLNHYVVGWIDWNMCLDPMGGPNWAHNYVDSPIIVYPDQDEFVKQPMFYAMGHFSKFIPRGSQRIHVARRTLSTVDHLAVLTPEGNIVIVLHNGRDQEVRLQINIHATRKVSIVMEPRSLKTIEINHQ